MKAVAPRGCMSVTSRGQETKGLLSPCLHQLLLQFDAPGKIACSKITEHSRTQEDLQAKNAFQGERFLTDKLGEETRRNQKCICRASVGVKNTWTRSLPCLHTLPSHKGREPLKSLQTHHAVRSASPLGLGMTKNTHFAVLVQPWFRAEVSRVLAC